MYMLTNEMVHQRVKSNFGIFTYEPTYAKMSSDGRVAYYAGKEGNPEQVCIAEVSHEETLYMSLFVGAGDKSAYERIQNQLAPKPKPIVPDETTAMPMTASRPSLQITLFVLLVLLSCNISR
ncbi:unnamed protein product [Onchocerca ochengi]|uniref:PROTEASOME_ALPHA_1 domain-containing protein n=1 Tax=Onchocerca ochengi TaxID=42157 RepID=A0A182EKB8_ONCOC|nr:unnamed protein product [Onchocerca ochengi]